MGTSACTLIDWPQVQKLFRWISFLQIVLINYNGEKTVNSVGVVRRNFRISRLDRSEGVYSLSIHLLLLMLVEVVHDRPVE